MHDKPVLA